MPVNHLFPPEGLSPYEKYTLSDLCAAIESGEVLEATVQRCDAAHTLHLIIGTLQAEIPRGDVVAPWISGADRDIAYLSRVGKQTCFTVKSVFFDEKGAPHATLSRAEAQEQAMEFFLKHLKCGSVVTGRVTRLEPFGAFVDIGRGIIALLPPERLSVSRVSHPRERLHPGQKILAAVYSFDRETRRITLTQRELLGTWLENAADFQAGETVTGIVRSIKDYGIFVELSPNLTGLADFRQGVSPGDGVSVFIKSIQPDRMKVKLHIIEKLPNPPPPAPLRWRITDGTLERWVYSPADCLRKAVETDFTVSDP